MDGISSTRSSLAFWGGALGPQLVHRAAARALDGEANVVAHAELTVAVTAANFLHLCGSSDVLGCLRLARWRGPGRTGRLVLLERGVTGALTPVTSPCLLPGSAIMPKRTIEAPCQPCYRLAAVRDSQDGLIVPRVS